ncbi:IS3 family transposase [Massilia endophytica]|uniref:IS3 family transposase n=1 Tax=Massilia endophytica TaxID=2899220 RepID=UPI001E460F7E|nr:IS3 family transposase [Massilia endophytica]UGQ46083.1 IS3 family transposase [Massilia endophytica]UGQ46651.1 IS3 family transposase [Massilia endophytica]UGQ47206.1 IS3 family transposase [Massilia endophytica]UGQ47393.1 IS3 family transposase [Massilia endophytica]UGQ47647.1 IS3 family transposase [Massilia endophytica]
MSGKRYTEEFKVAAVKQVLDRGHPAAQVAERLGVSIHSIYAWIKRYGVPEAERKANDAQTEEMRRLKAELKRVTEERDILPKGRGVLCQDVRVRYAFIREHQAVHSVRRLCKMVKVHPSGYYAWCITAESPREKENRRLLGHIKQSWLESGAVYGYRKVYDDLQELGEQCGINRVHRLMRSEGIRSQTGYAKRKSKRGGPPSVVAPNHLQREFDVTEPNKVWVTDITYLRTCEGWLYLAVVLDLFSRQVIGWSMSSRIDRELAMSALLMAVWRRQPTEEVMVHSDQGSQFSSYDWRDFLAAHGLVQSMSRRGNCHDNAVAESFFQLLKRERIRRKTYSTRDEARQDVFDYIEMFYNPKRRHGFSERLSPIEFEKRHSLRLQSV